MAQTLNLVFFDFKDSSVLVNELSRYYANSPQFDVENLEDANEVNQFLASSGNGIFFFKVDNKKELQQAVSILKGQKKLIKKGMIKPACISGIKNKKVETILAKYGCVDILEPDTKAKTLTFKLDFWSKPIVAQLDKIEKENELKMKRKEASQKQEEKKVENFKYEGTLDLESDVWIVKHKNDCKKVLRRWLLKLLGPSPFIGTWVELEAQPGDKLPTWKYVLKDSNNGDFIKDEGAWFFYGSKPDFDWKVNRWNFSSDLPHLYFYTREGVVHSRFKFENGQVVIKENSQFATMREDMILETCDAKYNFDGDEAEDEGSESLEGEHGADELNNLSGKLDGELEEDQDSTRKPGGYTEDSIDSNMSGKSSTDNLDGGPLSGKVAPGEEKEPQKDKKPSGFDEVPTPDNMNGKSSTDNLGGGHLAGNIAPGAEKEDDKKKKPNSYSDEALESNMSGKSSTDEIGGAPLAGKSSTDELGGPPLAGKSSTDELGGAPLAGKSSTDNLGSDPLSGKVKPNDPTEEEKKKDPMFKEEALPGHMGGKSSTDELGGGPLSGKVKPQDKKEEENKDSTFEEQPLPGNLGGKSSTDDLGNGPLSGKVNPSKPKEKEEKDSSFEEEALAGHMGGKSSTDNLGDGPLSGKLNPTAEKPNTPSLDELGEAPGPGKTNDLIDELGDPLNHPGPGTANPELAEPSFQDDPFADFAGAPDFSKEQLGELPGAPAPSNAQFDSPIVAPIVNLDDLVDPNTGEAAQVDSGIYDTEKAEAQGPDGKSKFDKANAEGDSPVDLSGYQIMEGFKQEGEEQTSNPMEQVIDNKAAVTKNELNSNSLFDTDLKNENASESNTGEKSGATSNPLGQEAILDGKPQSPVNSAAQASAFDDTLESEKPNLNNQVDPLASEDKNKESKSGNATSEKPVLNKEPMVGKKANINQIEKENDMLDALGGGLTDGDGMLDGSPADENTASLDTQIGSAVEQDEGPDLDAIIGQAVEVNLESGELKVVIKQQTDAGNDITFICNFEDFYEDELIVLAPKNSLPVGSEVRARVSLSYNGQKIKVDCLGKIEEIEELNETRDTLAISLNDVSKEAYDKFMELYQERQGSINEFMEMAKGY
jgi:hypothetical protein